MSDNPYIRKIGERLEVTEAGRRYLSELVTDVEGPVYAFTSNASPLMAAAAMARLSRRGSDLREIYLDEFAIVGEDAAGDLIERVVTGYGDDSVQQLIGVQLVVEGASNLLTKLLEWGRLMSYLEQSTRYIFFDQKDSKGRFLYYVPEGLGSIEGLYRQTMEAIFVLYSEIVRALTAYVRQQNPEPEGKSKRIAWLGATRAQACDAARPLLPVATKSTVGIFGSAQAVDSLIMHLLSEPLHEARTVGQQLLTAARVVIPEFLQRTDLPERGGATTAYRANTRMHMQELADKLLHQAPQEAASGKIILHSYWPRSELDLVADMLFEFSYLPLGAIREAVATWSDERKIEVYLAYLGERLNRRHRPGRALEEAHFVWEIDGRDYGTFRDVQRHRMVDDFVWQRLSPYHSYEVPKLVVDAGLEKKFHDCFDLSLTLHEAMIGAGLRVEAQYSTLLGHRMRYRLTANLRSLFHMIELRTQPAGHPGYRVIFNDMLRQLAEVYPLAAAAISRFANQDEDPALTRMAAELATQYKLEALDNKGT